MDRITALSLDAAYCLSVVCVSVCVLVTTVSPAKTAEPTDMLAWAQGTVL